MNLFQGEQINPPPPNAPANSPITFYDNDGAPVAPEVDTEMQNMRSKFSKVEVDPRAMEKWGGTVTQRAHIAAEKYAVRSSSLCFCLVCRWRVELVWVPIFVSCIGLM